MAKKSSNKRAKKTAKKSGQRSPEFRSGTRYFELTDNQSHKFWEVTLGGTDVSVRFGRIGSKGRTQTKSFSDEAAALAHANKLLEEKTAKGYAQTDKETATIRRGFETQRAEDPDDLATLTVYADWLMENGDPRGEFIHTQLALEDESLTAKTRDTLKAREKELLKAHQREWLGDLGEYLLHRDRRGKFGEFQSRFQFKFSRGQLDYLEIPDLTIVFARILAMSKTSAPIRHLIIKDQYFYDEDEYPDEPIEEGDGTRWDRRELGDVVPDAPNAAYWPSMYVLAQCKNLTNIRILQIGSGERDKDDDPYGPDSCRLYVCAPVVDLIKRMPRIEELYLFAHDIHTRVLFGLKNLRQLRILQVDHLHDYPLDVLGGNSALKNLQQFRIHNGGCNDLDELSIDVEQLKHITRSRHLKNLTHLRLRLTRIGDEGCEELVRSKIFKRLKFLDLRHGNITDEGAKVLADCADLTNLDFLGLGRNYLTKEGVSRLQATGVKLKADNQHELDDEYFFGEGDPE